MLAEAMGNALQKIQTDTKFSFNVLDLTLNHAFQKAPSVFYSRSIMHLLFSSIGRKPYWAILMIFNKMEKF